MCTEDQILARLDRILAILQRLPEQQSIPTAKHRAASLEYIKFEEAIAVTGLAEKTLRAKLRGHVAIVGHNAYLRKEFFEYWRQAGLQKISSKTDQDSAAATALGVTPLPLPLRLPDA